MGDHTAMQAGVEYAEAPISHAEDTQTFLHDVLEGLAQSPAMLSPKYFYDATGSRLFDRICELPEYYLTRTEMAILERSAPAIAEQLGPGVLLIEPGSGSCAKVGRLLRHLCAPAGYAPVEISGEHLHANLSHLRGAFPDLPITPVCADFTTPFSLPSDIPETRRRVVFFPGSTIGNFPPEAAVDLLRGFRGLLDDRGGLLLGVDRRKDPRILEAAYDDAAGVTAAFNRNLLVRMRDELGAEVNPAGFRHRALWNDECSRIEMHLVSRGRQTIRVGGRTHGFHDDEHIVTEYSYKYSAEGMQRLAAQAGFRVSAQWSDDREWFSVLWLTT